METVYDSLYKFSSYVKPIDLTFNQYLLMLNEPVLVHTGSHESAKALIPQLKNLLGNKELGYIFISHFESDECGGLNEVLKVYPHAKILCSEVTARQLSGFGMGGDLLIKKGGDILKMPDGELEFVSYPSEMHLWEGLLLVERQRKIFFSSDLVFRFGEYKDQAIEGSWMDEIMSITHEQVPDTEKRENLQNNLKAIEVAFVASGHGPCVKIMEE